MSSSTFVSGARDLHVYLDDNVIVERILSVVGNHDVGQGLRDAATRLVEDLTDAEKWGLARQLTADFLARQLLRPVADDPGPAVGRVFSCLLSAESLDASLVDLEELHDPKHRFAYWCEILLSLRALIVGRLAEKFTRGRRIL